MPFISSTTGSLSAGRGNITQADTPPVIKSFFVSPTGNDGPTIGGSIGAPFQTLNYALSRIDDQNTIYFRAGSYEFDEQTISTTGITLQGYEANVVFDGTRPISDLTDVSVNSGNWQTHTANIVTDANVTINNKTIYKVKLNSNVEIWQLFYNRKEVINARWPSAQWDDETVYSFDKWGHGYYDLKGNGNIEDKDGNVLGNGTGSPYYYENGEIVDVAHNNINLYNFVTSQQALSKYHSFSLFRNSNLFSK